MKELQPLTLEEIHTAYDKGEADVLALIAGWTNRLMARVEQQTDLVQRLQAKVKALEDQIAKNSRNSGKPPSSDGYNRPAPKSCFLQVKKCPLYYRKSAHFEKTDIKIIIKKGTTLLSKSSPFLSSTQSR